MSKMISFLRENEGATAIEYALMAFAITAVIALTVFTLGGTVSQLYQNYSGDYENASK